MTSKTIKATNFLSTQSKLSIDLWIFISEWKKMFIFKLRDILANPYGQNEKIFHLNDSIF